ncbi:MAG: PA2169 family four-helix-bundle protein [Alphaproteobacteria bacterium]|nr:PA2169 family four-helix-bundle protein [Alphaproteobacteria bacterium]
MENNEIVSTLNTLIETSRDGENGFRTCADGVDKPDLKTLFNEAARRCAQAIAELEGKVRGLGGSVATSGSSAGSLHRGWVNIKAAVTGKDEAAVLNECERGEDVAKRAYEVALKKDLPADIKAVVERQYHGVKQNHDRIRDLRNAARGRKTNMAETGLAYARTVREGVSAAVDQGTRSAGEMAEQAYQQGERATRAVSQRVGEQPLLAILLAFATGCGIGYLLHGTSARR